MSFFLSYQRQFAVTWQDLAYYKYEGKREKHIPFRWSQDKPLPAATWIKHTWITHLFTSSKGFCTWPVDVQVLILIVCYALILSCWLDILSELSFYNHRTTSFKKHTYTTGVRACNEICIQSSSYAPTPRNQQVGICECHLQNRNDKQKIFQLFLIRFHDIFILSLLTLCHLLK